MSFQKEKKREERERKRESMEVGNWKSGQRSSEIVTDRESEEDEAQSPPLFRNFFLKKMVKEDEKSRGEVTLTV